MNTIKTLLTAAAVVAASMAAFSAHATGSGLSECDRSLFGFNGTELNGFTVNGFTVNGFSLNGITMQGVTLNGFSLNGPGLNLQGPAANGIRLNGPGIVFQGPQANGFVDGQDSAPMAIKLASGKIIRLR